MKVSNMIESKYLRKEDLDDGDKKVTLDKVDQATMPTGENRYILKLREFEKALVLNTTGIRVLADAFGMETDDWTGHQAILYVDPFVAFKGQVVGGLRLRPVKANAPTPAVFEEDSLKSIPGF